MKEFIPIDYYRAIVGRENQHYYLAKFARYEGEGRIRPSWNWPACLWTFIWLLYRKMWLVVILWSMWVIFIVLGIPLLASKAPNPSDAMAIAWFLLVFLGVNILPGIYANAIYYKHCRRKIAIVRTRWQDKDRQLKELSRIGGSLSD